MSLLFLPAIPAAAKDPTLQLSRGLRFVQTNADAPVPSLTTPFAFFRAETIGVDYTGSFGNPTFNTPLNQSLILGFRAQDSRFIQFEFTTPEAVDARFPNGRYDLDMSLRPFVELKGHVTFAPPAEPRSPHVSNFAQAQAIYAPEDFKLTWDAFAKAGASDSIRLQLIRSVTAAVILDTQDLPPDTRSWTIPAGTLPEKEQIQARLIFTRGGPATVRDPGETIDGHCQSSSETTLSLFTFGSPRATPDTTPPQLVSTVPENKGLQDSLYSIAKFTFSEPMHPSGIAIAWKATQNGSEVALDTSSIILQWTPDQLALWAYGFGNANWPEGAQIEWTLNPNRGDPRNFRDFAGNVLGTQSGTFTSAGAVNACTAPGNSGQNAEAAFFVSKQERFLQVDSNAPQFDPTGPARIYAFVDLSPSLIGTGGAVRSPIKASSGFTTNYLGMPDPTNNFGVLNPYRESERRFFVKTFGSRDQLEAAFPGGVYGVELHDRSDAITSAELTVGDTNYPPIPYFTDYPHTTEWVANQDGILHWSAFAGATPTNAFITLSIFDANTNLVFRVPDPCTGQTLDPAATGVKIPSYTLSTANLYTAELSFSRLTDQGKYISRLPGAGHASLTRTTRITMKGVASTAAVAPIGITLVPRSGPGATPDTLSLNVTCNPGQPIDVLYRMVPQAYHQTFLRTNAPAAEFQLTLPIFNAQGFYQLYTP